MSVDDETDLYPTTPQLEQVHLAGLPAEWPLCAAARRFAAESHSPFRLPPPIADGFPNQGNRLNDLGSPCALGELTDRGSLSTLKLGQHFRNLYVHKLHFLPSRLSDPDMIYLRTSRYQRTYTTLQNVVTGLYPPKFRDIDTKTLALDMRDPKIETLLPNEDFCPRLIELFGRFSQVAAKRWDISPQTTYLNRLLQKYMPKQAPISVLSSPKIHGLFDTISTVLATPNPESYLPPEFFDSEARQILENIAADEEYMGFSESNEFRMLGIGELLGEVVERMTKMRRSSGFYSGTTSQARTPNVSSRRVGDEEDRGVIRRPVPRLALFACHDSTLAGIMTSLHAMKAPNWTWPGYTSFLAIELFSQKRLRNQQQTSKISVSRSSWTSLLHKRGVEDEESLFSPPREYFVRVSFNGLPLSIPACQTSRAHLEGDGTFCTLDTFAKVVEEFTPTDWKHACMTNLGKPILLDGDRSIEENINEQNRDERMN